MITERHLQKEGTPTIGGLIFIIPTIIAMLLLYIRGSLEITSSLIIILFVFISYSLLGLADDLKKIKKTPQWWINCSTKINCSNNYCNSFLLYLHERWRKYTFNSYFTKFRCWLKMGIWIFILFLLVGSSNAVNITDGEDGLAGDYPQ